MTATPFAPLNSPAQPPGTVIPGQVEPSTSAPQPQQGWFGQGGIVPTPAAPSVGTEQVFTREDIEKARSEERDKLHNRLSSYEQTLKDLKQAEDARQEQTRLAQEAADREAAEADRLASQERMTAQQLVEQARKDFEAQLAARDQAWNTKLEEESAARQVTDAMLQKERTFGELRDYTQAKIRENEENIAPQLLNWITGNSQEEIDQAIARAIQTSNEIAAAVREQLNPQAFQIQQQEPQTVARGVSPASGPTNMDFMSQQTQLTAEQIRDMPLPEYAKIRSQLLGRVSSPERGLYG